MRQAAYGIAQPCGLGVQVICEHSAASDPVTRGAGSAPRGPPETYRAPCRRSRGPRAAAPAARAAWLTSLNVCLRQLTAAGDPWGPSAERVTAAGDRRPRQKIAENRGGQSERLHVPCFSQTTQQKNDIDVPRGTIFSEKNRKPRAEVPETCYGSKKARIGVPEPQKFCKKLRATGSHICL